MAKSVTQSVYGDRLSALCGASLQALQAFETVRRHLHPPSTGGLRASAAPVRHRLEETVEDFRECEAPEGLEAFQRLMNAASSQLLEAMALFVDSGPPQEAMLRLLQSLRAHSNAQEVFYALRGALPPIASYFQESGCPKSLAELDPDQRDEAGVGIHAFHDDGTALSEAAPGGDRGGYWVYVPEWYRGDRAWPIVVALHGGSGHGREYLWTWLREARSRGFILCSPTSADRTWSFDQPELDTERLVGITDRVAERWGGDRKRMLLTGLSDGATFTLMAGLAEDAPYTALAPVSGVLHPACYVLGHLERAAGKRIYLVHGALDWLFPVQSAQLSRDELQRCEADLVYREIADLSHTYPRDENPAMLEWFDGSLALPAQRAAQD